MSFLRTLYQATNLFTSKALEIMDTVKVRVAIGNRNKKCRALYYKTGETVYRQGGGTGEVFRLRQEISPLDDELFTATSEKNYLEQEIASLHRELKEAKRRNNQYHVKELEERIRPLREHLRTTNKKISHLTGILRTHYEQLGEYSYQNRLPGRRLSRFYQEIDDLKSEIDALLYELERRNQARTIQRQNNWYDLQQKFLSRFTPRPGASPVGGEITINIPRPDQTENPDRNCPYCLTAIQARERTVICPLCETPHHEECWRDNGGCTVFGCRGRV